MYFCAFQSLKKPHWRSDKQEVAGSIPGLSSMSDETPNDLSCWWDVKHPINQLTTFKGYSFMSISPYDQTFSLKVSKEN